MLRNIANRNSLVTQLSEIRHHVRITWLFVGHVRSLFPASGDPVTVAHRYEHSELGRPL